MRWETERSYDGKLCQEYSYQKLSKSGNWFLSYSRKCRGCLLCKAKIISKGNNVMQITIITWFLLLTNLFLRNINVDFQLLAITIETMVVEQI